MSERVEVVFTFVLFWCAVYFIRWERPARWWAGFLAAMFLFLAVCQVAIHFSEHLGGN